MRLTVILLKYVANCTLNHFNEEVTTVLATGKISISPGMMHCTCSDQA